MLLSSPEVAVCAAFYSAANIVLLRHFFGPKGSQLNSSSQDVSDPQGLPFRRLEIKAALSIRQQQARIHRVGLMMAYVKYALAALFGSLIPHQLLCYRQQATAFGCGDPRCMDGSPQANADVNTPR